MPYSKRRRIAKSIESMPKQVRHVPGAVYTTSQLSAMLAPVFERQNELYGLRNRIIHDYDGVSFILLWDIVQMDLHDLKKQIHELLP